MTSSELRIELCSRTAKRDGYVAERQEVQEISGILCELSAFGDVTSMCLIVHRRNFLPCLFLHLPQLRSIDSAPNCPSTVCSAPLTSSHLLLLFGGIAVAAPPSGTRYRREYANVALTFILISACVGDRLTWLATHGPLTYSSSPYWVTPVSFPYSSQVRHSPRFSK